MSIQPWYQRLIAAFGLAFGGFIVCGAILDTIGNALQLVTPGVTYVGSVVVIAVVITAYGTVRIFRPRWDVPGRRSVRLLRLGVGAAAFTIGALMTLWVPRFTERFPRSITPSSLGGGAESTNGPALPLVDASAADVPPSVSLPASGANQGSVGIETTMPGAEGRNAPPNETKAASTSESNSTVRIKPQSSSPRRADINVGTESTNLGAEPPVTSGLIPHAVARSAGATADMDSSVSTWPWLASIEEVVTGTLPNLNILSARLLVSQDETTVLLEIIAANQTREAISLLYVDLDAREKSRYECAKSVPTLLRTLVQPVTLDWSRISEEGQIPAWTLMEDERVKVTARLILGACGADTVLRVSVPTQVNIEPSITIRFTLKIKTEQYEKEQLAAANSIHDMPPNLLAFIELCESEQLRVRLIAAGAEKQAPWCVVQKQQ